jgi:hypothetical protein
MVGVTVGVILAQPDLTLRPTILTSRHPNTQT